MAELERYRDVFTACFGKAYLIGSLHGVHSIWWRISSNQADTRKQHNSIALTCVIVWEF
jgi:hypothetical protein